jgi:hypothetical protein
LGIDPLSETPKNPDREDSHFANEGVKALAAKSILEYQTNYDRLKLRLHTMINRADFRFFQMLMKNVVMQLTMSSDDVDSVFFKYHLIKAEVTRLIVVCKRTFI